MQYNWAELYFNVGAERRTLTLVFQGITEVTSSTVSVWYCGNSTSVPVGGEADLMASPSPVASCNLQECSEITQHSFSDFILWAYTHLKTTNILLVHLQSLTGVMLHTVKPQLPTSDPVVAVCSTSNKLLYINHRNLRAYVHIKVVVFMNFSTVSTLNQQVYWKQANWTHSH